MDETNSAQGTAFYSLETYVDWAETLIQLMGSDWLAAHAARPYRTMHIIASWIQGYQSATPETLHLSQQLVQMGELMSNIATLRNAGVLNAEDRINDLRLDEAERVDSAIHEIRVAAGFVLDGHRVFFIPEAGSRTPDMLVDDAIEVECKHKCRMSSRDKQRYELYGILNRRLRSAFNENVPHSLLALEVMFDEEPSRQHIDRLIANAKGPLSQGQPAKFSDRLSGQYSAEYETFASGAGPDGLYLARERGRSKFDLRSTEGVVVDVAGPTFGRYINMSVGSKSRQDRVKGILRSIKSSASQFSGRFPAIASIDISETVNDVGEGSMAHLHDDIEAVLRNNTTISQARLTTTTLHQVDGRDVYGTFVDRIDNPIARYPLAAPLAAASC
jgi:hypothetical protein